MAKLRAEGSDDIKVISALIQDGITRASDIAFLKEERRFVIVFNRFLWEKKKRFLRPAQPERVRCALRIDFVDDAKFSGFQLGKQDTTLNLLSLSTQGNLLLITCASQAAIKLHVEVLDVTLEDISDPWPVKSRPNHQA